MCANLRRIFAVAQKNLQSLLTDKRTLGLLIGMPILMMVLFGYAFGQTVKHVPVKIVNLDYNTGTGNDTKYSDIGISFLQQDDRVDVTLLTSNNFNLTEEAAKVYGGQDYFALIVFPANFSEDMPFFNREINFSVYIDGSEAQVLGSIQAALSSMLNNVTNSLTGGKPHMNINFVYMAGSPDSRPVDTMAPGILSFALLLFMILTVTGGMTKERITGTIYRVLTTPTTKGDVVLGYLLGNSLIALVQSVLLLVIGVLIFNISIAGNLSLVFFILFIYALSCVGIGILASAFAETELQAFQFIPLILIPSMFFSGFLFPLNAFPEIFQWFSKIIPMTYSIRICRAIMINGFGWDMIMNDFLILIGLTISFIACALLVFKNKK